jgi:hypothetical protein
MLQCRLDLEQKSLLILIQMKLAPHSNQDQSFVGASPFIAMSKEA